MRHYSAGIIAALALLAATPVVAAGDLPDEHVIQYLAFVHTAENPTGAIPETNVTVQDVSSWGHVRGASILEIRASYLVQSSALAPAADYRVLWDSVLVDNCLWRIEGGDLEESGSRKHPYISIYCQLPAFQFPGNHTVEVQRTNVVGTPVLNSVTSIVLHQRETVDTMTTFESLTGLTAFEFSLLPALAITGLFLWTRAEEGIRIFGNLLILVAAALTLGLHVRIHSWTGLFPVFILFLSAWAYTAIMLFWGRKEVRNFGL